ncbi:MAG: class I SAM-dependent methyltransferase [Bacteroidales bacterium]|nr:class I SAM-dependent methyltransferase [Bacteroidales bacterium]
MPLSDYFSKDANRRAKFIFNLIAPVYAGVDTALMKHFSRAAKIVDAEIGIRGKSVLDIGTGTGAWAAVFKRKGAGRVHGIDFSEKMLVRSRKKHPEVSFSNGIAENLPDFDDNSFDIVTASFVLHGVKKDSRKKMLLEMQRISKKHVVIHDFSGKTPLFLRFLEFMEKSDYKNFKINFCEELKSLFFEVEKTETGNGSGLYFATTQNE